MHENPFGERRNSALLAPAVLYCIECLRPWVAASERWQLKILEEDSGPETVPYCPACAEREFGQS